MRTYDAVCSKRIATAALALAIVLSSGTATGAPIVLAIEATVTLLDDPDGLLTGSGLALGSTITGSLTFESTTADVNPLPGQADYAGAVLLVDVDLGAFSFVVNPGAAFINRIVIWDDLLASDGYTNELQGPTASLDGTPLDWGIYNLVLSTSNLAVITSEALPPGLPGSGPGDFDTDNFIQIVGQSGASGFQVNATPTAAMWLPEPAVGLLLAAGLAALAVRPRR